MLLRALFQFLDHLGRRVHGGPATCTQARLFREGETGLRRRQSRSTICNAGPHIARGKERASRPFGLEGFWNNWRAENWNWIELSLAVPLPVK